MPTESTSPSEPIRMVGSDRGRLEGRAVPFEPPRPSVQCRFREGRCRMEATVFAFRDRPWGTEYHVEILLSGGVEEDAITIAWVRGDNAGHALERVLWGLSRVVGQLTDVLPQGPDL